MKFWVEALQDFFLALDEDNKIFSKGKHYMAKPLGSVGYEVYYNQWSAVYFAFPSFRKNFRMLGENERVVYP